MYAVSGRTVQSDYMHFAKFGAAARFNLATSGVPDASLADLQLDLANLVLAAPNAGRHPPLIERLADRGSSVGHAAAEALGRRARSGPASVAGLAAAGTATGLAGTARGEAHGMTIPALHDAASDRPVPYTPVCGGGAVPVCLQPAYRGFLPDVTAALGPVLSQMAGLPGAPARVIQVAVTSVRADGGNGVAFGGPVIGGRPPVLYLPLAGLPLPGEGNASAAQFVDYLRQTDGPWIVGVLVGLPAVGAQVGAGVNAIMPNPGSRHSAQLAVLGGLVRALGLAQGGPLSVQIKQGGGGTPSVTDQEPAAARRFAALPAAARHAWLMTHLAALRAGRVTLSEIP